MGHVSGSVARIRFAERGMGARFGFQQEPDGSFYRRRLTFAPEVLAARRLLNTYFMPGNFPPGDPAMGSGALSGCTWR